MMNTVHLFQGNEYRQLGDKMPVHTPCTVMMKRKDVLEDYYSKMTFPLRGPCPVQPVKYNFSYILNINFSLQKMWP